MAALRGVRGAGGSAVGLLCCRCKPWASRAVEARRWWAARGPGARRERAKSARRSTRLPLASRTVVGLSGARNLFYTIAKVLARADNPERASEAASSRARGRRDSSPRHRPGTSGSSGLESPGIDFSRLERLAPRERRASDDVLRPSSSERDGSPAKSSTARRDRAKRTPARRAAGQNSITARRRPSLRAPARAALVVDLVRLDLFHLLARRERRARWILHEHGASRTPGMSQVTSEAPQHLSLRSRRGSSNKRVEREPALGSLTPQAAGLSLCAERRHGRPHTSA